MAGPRKEYDQLVADGDLHEDEAQATAADLLQQLHSDLKAYRPGRKSLFGKQAPAPRGVYLWGGVGRGKSLLMDLFFDNARLAPKQRVHFHEFMAETHEAIAKWRKMDDVTRRKQKNLVRRAVIDDPIPHVARGIFQKANLLCFDEFQVTDIADAMILGRLFEQLFADGAVIVATSNRVPDDLYKDGINRQVFLPFIQMIKDRLTVHELTAGQDYRMAQFEGVTVYHYPLGMETDQAMDETWERLTMAAEPAQETLHVRGREVQIPCAARGAARARFKDLCEAALGAEDYLAIARNYNTLFLYDIPRLTPERRNEAKRFVTLIDALYEHKTKLICSAEVAPLELYPAGDGSFEFERTVSRLMEMQTKDYLGEEHDHGEISS